MGLGLYGFGMQLRLHVLGLVLQCRAWSVGFRLQVREMSGSELSIRAASGLSFRAQLMGVGFGILRKLYTLNPTPEILKPKP